MNERYLRWWTPHLSRDFEMLVFGDGGGLPLILFPTSFGNFRQCKDFHLTEACADFVDSGRITLYCPDAIDLDSFYNKSIHPADRIKTHMAYENVILHDVIDFARREAGCHRVAVPGASLGAYHVPHLAFRHPDAVTNLIRLIGALVSHMLHKIDAAGARDSYGWVLPAAATARTTALHGPAPGAGPAAAGPAVPALEARARPPQPRAGSRSRRRPPPAC